LYLVAADERVNVLHHVAPLQHEPYMLCVAPAGNPNLPPPHGNTY
jgi:hypothetical protein